jgi:5-methylcytosine-specific restriction endonuclease McrA
MPTDRKDRDRRRDARPYRRWYKTARWQRLSRSVIERDGFICQWPGCGKFEPKRSMLVADHRTPHRGDETLFWDENNLWTLCKPCHDSRKQREERSGSMR